MERHEILASAALQRETLPVYGRNCQVLSAFKAKPCL